MWRARIHERFRNSTNTCIVVSRRAASVSVGGGSRGYTHLLV
jgi:hypothetical protein